VLQDEGVVTRGKCQIVSQTEVFFRLYRDRIIGITGTKGKSTTTTLVYHILKQAGIPVVLAGNIGIPVFAAAEGLEEDTVIVVELSSHQLEYMTVSPRYGVLLNIHEEHLDHYGTMERYVAAKQHIYTNQRPGDRLFCNIENEPEAGGTQAEVTRIGAAMSGAEIQVSESSIRYGEQEVLIQPKQMKLVGKHNYFNIAAAYGVCREFQVSDSVFLEALASYEPLPHRLQFVATVDGVDFYDDSISTICETTIQALESLPNTDTVLIGGMDRGIHYQELIQYLSGSTVRHIILMASTGKRIYEEIRADYPEFHEKTRLLLVDTLEEAVVAAKRLTAKGTCCVLSPAAASYGIFRNFEERGDVFQKYVTD
jgi:UDP-N-acetylmuramoylalanine--D-glutamate ligase